MEREVELLNETVYLRNEANANKDLLFVDVVDTYRSLPRKLLEFYKWTLRGEVPYILKTDDDCYLDVDRILKNLKMLAKKNLRKVWWSRFRYDWAVEQYGKWAERHYKSITYPPFACGSGHVLSQDIVRWLDYNSDDLMMDYQGEDTSLGIWLAAVNPAVIDDKSWSCDDLCKKGTLSLANIGPDDLRTLWKNKVTCDNPCQCS
ncbi:UDP-GalNAc:beta-1,3-N-acetylgalactosaminyltransferase 2-like [Tubulanus polymorphus]|uniref:UDP-GalNAc:beta-1, 3-N-acetylgalactosaminyltransferase 2-like n=1 Tax=Tubulanus polymorphus TaxID=672921 RepID=UPI003DA66BCA